jgi:hypothetical protein
MAGNGLGGAFGGGAAWVITSPTWIPAFLAGPSGAWAICTSLGSGTNLTSSRCSAVRRYIQDWIVSPPIRTCMIGIMVVKPPVSARPTKNAATIDTETFAR